MAGYKVPYLVRRAQFFSFRMVVPRHLRGIACRREIKVSLRTFDVRAARLRCQTLSAFFVQLIAKVEAIIELQNDEIEAIARRYFLEKLNFIQQVVSDAPKDAGLDLRFEASDSLSEVERLRDMLVARRFDGGAWSEADTAARLSGVSFSSLDLETRESICAVVSRARMEHHRIYASALRGRFDELAPQDGLFANLNLSVPILPLETSDPPQPIGMTLEEAVRKFVEHKRAEWAPKTLMDYTRVLKLFAEISGQDHPLRLITTGHMQEFRDALRVLPPNYSKQAVYRGLGVREIVRLAPHDGGLNVKTANKYLDLLKSFLRWCESEEYLEKVPGNRVAVAGGANQNLGTKRVVFSPDDLRRLFMSPVYIGSKSAARRSKPGTVVLRDAKFWVPIIGLFTGMRLAEIVQLRVGDVLQTQGIPFFRVSRGENNEKTIKTESSQRDVPLHSELIRCGWNRYMAALTDQHKDAQLFPELSIQGSIQPSNGFGKWFGRYLDDIGMPSRKLVFHSFRHTFVDAAELANIPRHRAQALTGHADNSVHASYGSKISIAILNEELQRLGYDLDLSHLH